MNTSVTWLAGACLAVLLAAPAAAATAATTATEDDAFGPLRQLAGSCWRSDSAPAFEICYRFDAGGRTLYSRQYFAGHVRSEASITAGSQPGWLLETARWAQSPYTVVSHLRIDAGNGRMQREPVRPLHDDPEAGRRATGSVVDSLRLLSADRFVLVRHMFAPVRDWRPAAPTLSTWNFTRSRPCEDADLAVAP